jgi:hypothetical protein
MQSTIGNFRSTSTALVNTQAWFGGGFAAGINFSTVDRITFATDTATATTRGPLSSARDGLAAAGNTTDGWFGGGSGPVGHESTVDRITYATDTATASVRGPLSGARIRLAAAGNTTDGWFGGGATEVVVSTVQRITYATDTATASVRGPLSLARYKLAAVGNSDYAWFGGGYNPARSTVDRITFATDTATASVRGPLSSVRYYAAAAGNTTDGWFGGGYRPISASASSTVDRITYATDTATASVRGPLSFGRRTYASAAGNTTDGWFGGGLNPAASPSILSLVDRITYATDTATASVRGPLSGGRSYLAAASNIQL